MRAALIATTIFAMFAARAGAELLAPGTYTNEEEVYFDNEGNRPPAPWLGMYWARRCGSAASACCCCTG